MKHEVLIGQTDYTVLVKIRDDAGAPATGLTEASIDIAYARVETDNDVTTTDVTPAALSALTDAHTDWGFEEVSATDHPGVYRLDIADAVFASGAWSAVVSVTGTGLDPADLEFVLVAFNPRDGVRLGLTALPNAAADAAGGLPISDAGGLDLDAKLANTHEVTAARMGALTDWIDGGRLDLILDARASQASVDTIDDFLDTEIADILTDTGTTLDDFVDDLESRLTAALATALQAHALGIGRGVVGASSTTTAVVFSTVNGNAPDATNDHYNGRSIVFTSGNLALQATSITDYTGGTTTATVPALTEAPAENDTFIIV